MKFSCNAQCEEQERQRHANKLKTNEYWYLKCLFHTRKVTCRSHTRRKVLCQCLHTPRDCVNVGTLLVTVPMSAHSLWLCQCLHTRDCVNVCTLLVTVSMSAHSWLCQCLHTRDCANVCTLVTVSMSAHSSWLCQCLHTPRDCANVCTLVTVPMSVCTLLMTPQGAVFTLYPVLAWTSFRIGP